MNASETLAALAPTQHERVYDLVAAAGLDVSDWANFAGGAAKASVNPKYCYEWCFESETCVVLCLWHQDMQVHENQIQYRFNLREDALEFERKAVDPRRRTGAQAVWARRTHAMDRAVQHAFRKGLPVRVIVVAGKRKDKALSDDTSSVDLRTLDPMPWAVSSYEWMTGEIVLTRGEPAKRFIDQFDVADEEEKEPKKVERTGTVYERDPKVRERVLERAQGECELCSAKGFETAAGYVYLETHHVVPLSEGGLDTTSNVVALCPNDHRRAHYSVERESIRIKLLELLALRGDITPEPRA